MYLLIETDNFEVDQRNCDIGKWHLGADLAGWLYSIMLPCNNVSYLHGPVMEDWGWVCGFKVDDARVLLSIGNPESEPSQWLLFIEVRGLRNTFFRKKTIDEKEALKAVSELLTQILSRESHVKSFNFSEKNPKL